MPSEDVSCLNVLRAEVVRQGQLASIDASIASALLGQAKALQESAKERWRRTQELLLEIDAAIAKVLPEVEEDTVAW